MSAYRRLNRTARPLTLQPNSYPLLNGFQSNNLNDETANDWFTTSGNKCLNDDEPNSNSSTIVLNGSNRIDNECQQSNHHQNQNHNNHSINSFDNLNSSLPATVHTSSTSANSLQTNASGQSSIATTSTMAFVPQPKHIRFPDVPYQSELLNELMIFSYTFLAAAMQFLHLYRTVWWLPESNTDQTMVRILAISLIEFYQ